MNELTSESSLPAAWARFIGPADVVGIKINPSGAPACCSSPEIIREIVGGVQSVGVPASNIFIYDRYAYEIDVGSYQADRKSTRLNSSHLGISYAVFCLKKK